MNEYQIAKKRIDISVGESVKIIRELQKLTQNQLAELTGIPQSTISAIEHDKASSPYGACGIRASKPYSPFPPITYQEWKTRVIRSPGFRCTPSRLLAAESTAIIYYSKCRCD